VDGQALSAPDGQVATQTCATQIWLAPQCAAVAQVTQRWIDRSQRG
jgi:hypothetical protein